MRWGLEHPDYQQKALKATDRNRESSELKANKCPGSDGLPAGWYKTFGEQLIPLLELSLNHTLEHGELPPSWKEAVYQ